MELNNPFVVPKVELKKEVGSNVGDGMCFSWSGRSFYKPFSHFRSSITAYCLVSRPRSGVDLLCWVLRGF